VTLQAVTSVEFHVVSLPHSDYMKASGYSLLHRAARLFLREVSTLTTEMYVLSLFRSPGTSRLVFYNFSYVSNLRRIVPHTLLTFRRLMSTIVDVPHR